MLWWSLLKLQSDDWSTRQSTVTELSKAKDPRLVNRLIDILNNGSKKPFTRSNAAEILGNIGDRSVYDPLVAALSDTEQPVRIAASRALAHLGDQRAVNDLINLVWSEDKYVRQEALFAICRLVAGGEVTIPVIIDSARNKFEELSYFLPEFGKSSLQGLIRLLQCSNPTMKWYVLEALRSLKRSEAIDSIQRALKDESESVRSAAARSLSVFNDPRVLEALGAALQDPSSEVQAAAAEALARLGERKGPLHLFSLLNDPDHIVVRRVAHDLGEIGNPGAADPLHRVACSHPEADVRLEAVRALQQLNDPRVVDTLISNLPMEHYWWSSSYSGEAQRLLVRTDPNWRQLPSARRLIPHLIQIVVQKEYDKEANKMLDEYLGSDASSCADAKEMAPWLIDHLRTGEKKPAAARMLGRIRDDRALQPLIEALDNADWSTRVAAAEALGQFRNPVAVDPLLSKIGDDLSSYVIMALAEIGSKRALEPLVERLDTAHPQTL